MRLKVRCFLYDTPQAFALLPGITFWRIVYVRAISFSWLLWAIDIRWYSQMPKTKEVDKNGK